MNALILLVEDDSSLGVTLTERLKKEGFEVEWAKTLVAAHDHLNRKSFSLLILDVGLPDGSGFDFAREIKKKIDIPLIFLTAQSEAEDRLKGYEIGAEEFIPKPFHLKELLLRVQHVLDNHKRLNRLEVGDVAIDFSAMTITAGERVERLNVKETKVLQTLVYHSPQVLSRDEILNRVWGQEEFPTNRTVDNVILRLRQLLGRASDCIQSVRGVGYQWIISNIQTKE